MTDAREPWRDVVVVAVVSSLLAVPYLLVRFPIGQDLPAHIETAAQIAALWRGDGDVASRYVLHTPPWPNALPTVLLAAMLTVMDGLDAARLLSSLALVAWPTSLAVLSWRLGRPPLVALLVLPTAYDLSFAYGFLHFVVGKPLWVLSLAAAATAARHPRTATLLSFVLVEVLLFHTHLLLWLSSLPLAALVIIARGRDFSARVLALVAGALGAAPGLWWLAGRQAPAGEPIVRPFADAVSSTWSQLGDLAPGAADGLGWAVAVAVALVAILLSRGQARFFAGGEVLVVVGLCTLAFSWLGPVRTPEASVVAERFTAPGVAVLILLVPVAILRGRRRAAVIGGGIAIAIALVVPTTLRWQAFARDEMDDFDGLLGRVPAGSAVATIFEDPLSPYGLYNARWHWPKLVALRGATTDDSFAWRDTCVVGLAPGAAPIRPPLRRGGRLTATTLQGFDHLLVQGHDRQVEAAVARGDLKRVMATGVWELFAIPSPRR